jgi:predicted amidohydrolase YtcJ
MSAGMKQVVFGWALLLATTAAHTQAQPADRIWTGGPVLTMNDAAMRAEAVAVRDGRIVAVGTTADVMKLRGAATTVTDLGGRTMVPGFVDAHGHIFLGGLQALSANVLAPPDGKVTDIPSLQRTLREWAAANQAAVDRYKVIVGFGYDQAQLKELRHPTRDDLDAVSTEVAILLMHQSGHLAAVNSKGLEALGYTKDTKDPVGGVIRRREDGTPNGVLEESAAIPAAGKLLGVLGPSGIKALATAGAKLWASYGYTTVQEGRAVAPVVDAMREVAAEGGFAVDVAVYGDVLVDREYIKSNASRTYKNRLRVAGAKLSLDGSPQGFTAWRDKPYFDPVGTYPAGYVGYAAAPNEVLVGAIDWAFANGVQIITHGNGEASMDLLIAAITQARKKYGTTADRRAVLIHGQFAREDQIDAFKRLQVIPSFFPMHTFYWGDWHRDHTVGPEAADDISPTGWAVKRGMLFTSHHDAPVAFPDSMRVLDATVTRRSRSGDIIGPAQRVDVITALKAMTLWSAYSHFEDDTKGSIEVGKLADLVILSADPTAVDPETLDKLKVTETIKEGKTIFTRAGDAKP